MDEEPLILYYFHSEPDNAQRLTSEFYLLCFLWHYSGRTRIEFRKNCPQRILSRVE
jgi:hypothetical protein